MKVILKATMGMRDKDAESIIKKLKEQGLDVAIIPYGFEVVYVCKEEKE